MIARYVEMVRHGKTHRRSIVSDFRAPVQTRRNYPLFPPIVSRTPIDQALRFIRSVPISSWRRPQPLPQDHWPSDEVKGPMPDLTPGIGTCRVWSETDGKEHPSKPGNAPRQNHLYVYFALNLGFAFFLITHKSLGFSNNTVIHPRTARLSELPPNP
jgi:hypothetical protein